MNYEIDRKTKRFHFFYKPGGAFCINEIISKGESCYFRNNKWQDDFAYYPDMSDEQLDKQCESLVARQSHLPQESKKGLVNLLKTFLKKIFP